MFTLLSHSLVKYPATHYLIGFSGGRDSHVLLDLLCELRDEGVSKTPLTAIHVNHNFNPKALDWVAHCQKICAAYGVPLIVETITDSPKKGESIEAFARDARYRLIEQHVEEDMIFLSAHHQRDQAETFLLQLMRGAGLDGLRAMPAARAFGVGRYVRPLLTASYTEILAYAEVKELDFIEDDSNADTRFDRNFLRHDILPVLEKRFPQATANIAQSAKWLAEVPETPAPERLIIATLRAMPEPTKKQHIRAFVKLKTGRALSQTQTRYILTHHLTADKDKHPTLMVGDYVIRRHAGELCVTAKLPALPVATLTAKVGQSLTVAPIGLLNWRSGQGIMTERPLKLQPLCGGERFHPHTRNRATTVKKILHEAKIPAWLRPYYWGLYEDNELLAIPSVGVAKNHYQKSPKAGLPLWIISDKFVRI